MENCPSLDCGCQNPCDCFNGNSTVDNTDSVILKNNTNTCLGIVKDTTTLTTFITNLLSYIKNIFSSLTSRSLRITPSGTACNSSATIEIVPSSDLGNSFILGSDGKAYVPRVEFLPGSCITFSKVLVNGVILFTPIIDKACLASLLCPICASISPILINNCGIPKNVSII